MKKRVRERERERERNEKLEEKKERENKHFTHLARIGLRKALDQVQNAQPERREIGQPRQRVEILQENLTEGGRKDEGGMGQVT